VALALARSTQKSLGRKVGHHRIERSVRAAQGGFAAVEGLVKRDLHFGGREAAAGIGGKSERKVHSHEAGGSGLVEAVLDVAEVSAVAASADMLVRSERPVYSRVIVDSESLVLWGEDKVGGVARRGGL